MTSIPHDHPPARLDRRVAGRHGKPGGRADAARRLDEAHKLLEEVHNMLTAMRREMLGPTTRGRA